jgi:phosphosulfolactate phosphohydrolase-like enzyme
VISIITTYAAMKYNGSWENTLDTGKKYGLKVVFINIYGWNQTASSVEF